jgi:hypothetical protein
MFTMMLFIAVMLLAMIGMQLESMTVAVILLSVVIGTGARVGMELRWSKQELSKGGSIMLRIVASAAIIAAPFIDLYSLVVLTEGIASLVLGYFLLSPKHSVESVK